MTAAADTALAARVRRLVQAMAPEPLADLADEHRLVEDLGFDSLRLMELTLALERGFELPRQRPQDLVGVRRIGEVIALVENARGSDHG
ncbi:acyl carrier protein [Nocardia amikacinitolerans]|uniref:acyl carrier protein n=1 Tax=Nocardia amikacinitolerans TaxID=756689 RepID=UPI0020A4241A|nr:acyl carrier protein [Nocardia amikacinitolerans]MCP2297444.1 acyl carrier protein [Nocardia amikacinitolerans]